MPNTTYTANKLLDLIFGGTAWSTHPSVLYFALFTEMPTIAGGGTEVSGGSYSRKAVAVGHDNFVTYSSVVNTWTDIVFPRATASWGTVVGWGFYDAATSGNLLWFGRLSVPETITAGKTPAIPRVDLGFDLSLQYGNYIASAVLGLLFFGDTPISFPTHYFALGWGVTPAGLTTETSGTSYARKSMTNNKTTYGSASGGVLSNAALILFATAGGTWTGPITHWAIYDAASSGNCLWVGQIATQVSIVNTNAYQWAIGGLNVSLIG